MVSFLTRARSQFYLFLFKKNPWMWGYVGSTIVVSGDGRYWSKDAIQVSSLLILNNARHSSMCPWSNAICTTCVCNVRLFWPFCQRTMWHWFYRDFYLDWGSYFEVDCGYVLQIIIKIAAANGVKRVWVGQDGLLSTPAVSGIIRDRVGPNVRTWKFEVHFLFQFLVSEFH